MAGNNVVLCITTYHIADKEGPVACSAYRPGAMPLDDRVVSATYLTGYAVAVDAEGPHATASLFCFASSISFL